MYAPLITEHAAYGDNRKGNTMRLSINYIWCECKNGLN